jgi:hypothetical protein
MKKLILCAMMVPLVPISIILLVKLVFFVAGATLTEKELLAVFALLCSPPIIAGLVMSVLNLDM